jgi:hypothetical protein
MIMATLTKVFITAKYNSEYNQALGNRWDKGKTEIILLPAENPASGKWNSNRGSDIDSAAGSDHARYLWNRSGNILAIGTGGFQDQNSTDVLVVLWRMNNFKLGQSGNGVFKFRKKEIPIKWELTVMEYV